jgi:hypothetical protein
MNKQTAADATAAPVPTGSQVLGARIRIHARNHPARFALGGGIATGAGTAALALLSAAPTLTDPTGIPGWVLVSVLVAMAVAALLMGLALFFYARSLPKTNGTDPARYASARLQAASGELGPDPETNRLARRLSDRMERTNNPGYAMLPLFAVLAFISVRPLTEITGPDFQPLMLLQLVPNAVCLAALVAVYFSARGKHAQVRRFRESYDAAHA